MFYHDFVAPIAPALIIRAFDAPDSKIRHPFKKKSILYQMTTENTSSACS